MLDIIVSIDDATPMHYPGGKAKTFHHVINLIPPHKVYIEPFLGYGSVMRAKRRSEIEIGIDLDSRILESSSLSEQGVTLLNADGLKYIKTFPFEGHEVIYCDPPYLPETRKKLRVYRHDFTEENHIHFLEIITRVNTRVIISGYDSDIYRRYLEGWHVYTYNAKTHSGVRQECLWHNFPRPNQLHDYRYLGSNFRERQTISRRIQRMQRRIESLSEQERSLILSWLSSLEASYAG